jgi:prophage DNA circulation protein
MKSIIKRTIYTGLGLVGNGTDAVNNLVQELAKKANISEAEGEKVARKLQARSIMAVRSIRRMLDAEVTTVADAIHATIRQDIESNTSSSISAVKGSSRKAARTSPMARATRAGGKSVRIKKKS